MVNDNRVVLFVNRVGYIDFGNQCYFFVDIEKDNQLISLFILIILRKRYRYFFCRVNRMSIKDKIQKIL